MIKEVIIFAIAFLVLCDAGPVEDSKPEVVAVAVPVESIEEAGDALESNDDLESSASYWRYRPYYGGGGWRGGWGGGYYGGGWGRGYGGYGWGHRGHGWGRGYWG